MNRYNLRKIKSTNSGQYVPYLRERNLTNISHYETARLNYPFPSQLSKLQIINKTWIQGMSLWALAQEYYGDQRYWWVIAWYNQTPTECDIALGQNIQIPLPLNKILEMLRV